MSFSNSSYQKYPAKLVFHQFDAFFLSAQKWNSAEIYSILLKISELLDINNAIINSYYYTSSKNKLSSEI